MSNRKGHNSPKGSIKYLGYRKKCNDDLKKWRKIKRETDPNYRKEEKERLAELCKKDYRKIKSLRLRFNIFKRDKYTCQYCGRKAPDVVLQIDHIHPKAKGGQNVINNYVTACKECNLGKGDILLKAGGEL